MSERLWAEYRAYAATLDPARRVAGPEELRRMMDASKWTGEIYDAEHTLFSAEHGTPGIVGTHGDYQWLTSVEHNITDLLRHCPDIVQGKYLAVTRRDGTSLCLTDEEKNAGWSIGDARVFQGTSWEPPEYREDWKVAYSPRVTSIHGLPNETREECWFNEWYVFTQPVPAGEIEAFVNWIGFRLYDPDSKWQWCLDRFWDQMARLTPESYIAEGTVFTIVTRNPALFAGVLSGFSADDEMPHLPS